MANPARDTIGTGGDNDLGRERAGTAAGRKPSGARRDGKSEAAFRTISEVSAELDVPQHVLRFWESKFSQIRPMKRGGGRRYYRPEDISLLRRVRDLLYQDGFTIRGVQKLLKESGVKALIGEDSFRPFAATEGSSGQPPGAEGGGGTAASPNSSLLPVSARSELRAVIEELESLRTLLRDARG